jgi:hypothetical protein
LPRGEFRDAGTIQSKIFTPKAVSRLTCAAFVYTALGVMTAKEEKSE